MKRYRLKITKWLYLYRKMWNYKEHDHWWILCSRVAIWKIVCYWGYLSCELTKILALFDNVNANYSYEPYKTCMYMWVRLFHLYFCRTINESFPRSTCEVTVYGTNTPVEQTINLIHVTIREGIEHQKHKLRGHWLGGALIKGA